MAETVLSSSSQTYDRSSSNAQSHVDQHHSSFLSNVTQERQEDSISCLAHKHTNAVQHEDRPLETEKSSSVISCIPFPPNGEGLHDYGQASISCPAPVSQHVPHERRDENGPNFGDAPSDAIPKKVENLHAEVPRSFKSDMYSSANC